MVFQIRTYSVLLVSSGEKFNSSLRTLLPVNDFYPVDTVNNAASARRALLERNYDIIIINSPLPDEFGSGFAIHICSTCNSGVLMFVKNDVYEDVYDKVMEYGAFVLSKPAPLSVISQSLKLMCAMRERIRKMEEKQVSVEEKINEIRILNHAKWLLIEKRNMTENNAQKYIEKTAMDNRRSKKEIAQNIINELESVDNSL